MDRPDVDTATERCAYSTWTQPSKACTGFGLGLSTYMTEVSADWESWDDEVDPYFYLWPHRHEPPQPESELGYDFVGYDFNLGFTGRHRPLR